MNRIEHPINLEGEKVKLVPLDSSHFPALLEISRDNRIWEYYSANGGNPDRLLLHLKSAVLKRATLEQYAFTVIDKPSSQIIGSTMLYNFSWDNSKLEIGWTWSNPAYWRTGHNRECKLLLLTYCFETLGAIRVQFLTDAINTRSRQALEGMGCTMEGILRNERIKDNGGYRNSVVFSVIDSEWPDVKQKLIAQIYSR
jgi:RimJ/RimL family protein N-acetyltransferase